MGGLFTISCKRRNAPTPIISGLVRQSFGSGCKHIELQRLELMICHFVFGFFFRKKTRGLSACLKMCSTQVASWEGAAGLSSGTLCKTARSFRHSLQDLSLRPICNRSLQNYLQELSSKVSSRTLFENYR